MGVCGEGFRPNFETCECESLAPVQKLFELENPQMPDMDILEPPVPLQKLFELENPQMPDLPPNSLCEGMGPCDYGKMPNFDTCECEVVPMPDFLQTQ